MASFYLCDNCHSDNGGGSLNTVHIVAGPDPVEYSAANRRWSRDLCDACTIAIAHLDFALFAKRHDQRVRQMDLS